MLHEQDISKITVQALCETAAINRSTFYNHYQSPQAVLKNMEKEFAAGLKHYLQDTPATDNEKDTPVFLLTKVIEFVQMNPNICFLLQTPGLKSEFKKNIFEHIFHIGLSGYSVFENYSGETLAYVQTFFLYGTGHVIDAWVRGGCKESPHEIATILAGFLTK